jgi:hypothetical protein
MAFGILTEWTPRRMLGIFADKGRKAGQTSGSHVADLAALGKVISLGIDCCARKFSPRANGYVTRPSLPLARGWCDGCHEYRPVNRLFFKQGAFN